MPFLGLQIYLLDLQRNAQPRATICGDREQAPGKKEFMGSRSPGDVLEDILAHQRPQ